MKKFIFFAIIALLCGCNEYTIYKDKFVAFDPASSSVTSVHEQGDFTGAYVVHYTGETPSTRFTVEWEVVAGNGLQEGRDFEIENSGRNLTFMPGVFSQPIRVHWLPSSLDASKDNSVTIRLVSGPDDVILGMPGPDGLFRQIIITKYKD